MVAAISNVACVILRSRDREHYNIATTLGVSHVDLDMTDDQARRAAEKVQKR